MNPRHRPWLASEVTLLKRLYVEHNQSLEQLAERFGRTTGAVKTKLYSAGVYKPKRPKQNRNKVKDERGRVDFAPHLPRKKRDKIRKLKRNQGYPFKEC